MWLESQFTKISGAPANHLHFAIVERHRPIPVDPSLTANKKKFGKQHPRYGAVVLTGYFDTASGSVRLLDAKSKK